MNEQIKFPLRVRQGKSGLWIEDDQGVEVCSFNLLTLGLAEGEMCKLAETMAAETNLFYETQSSISGGQHTNYKRHSDE